jgi:hypothetical protein
MACSVMMSALNVEKAPLVLDMGNQRSKRSMTLTCRSEARSRSERSMSRRLWCTAAARWECAGCRGAYSRGNVDAVMLGYPSEADSE